MRQIDIVELPLAKNATILHPENVVLKWSQQGVNTLDVGAFCYLERFTKSVGRSRKSHAFNLSTHSPVRATFVKALVEFYSTAKADKTLRDKTAHNQGIALRTFLNWVDAKENRGVYGELHTRQDWLNALKDWVNVSLKTRVAQSSISLSSGVDHMENVIRLLRRVFKDDEFGEKLKGGPRGKSGSTPTEVPPDDTQKALLSAVAPLFEEICDLVLGHKPYPFRVDMARSRTVERGYLWLFPGQGILNRSRAYNFETGEIDTYQALCEKFPAERSKRLSYFLSTAKAALEQANADTVDAPGWLRLEHATLACLCFAAMFLFETSVNLQQLLEMEWSESIAEALKSPDVKIHKWRRIKWRAGDKEIEIQVGHGFLPKFKRYLALRKFVMQGQAHASLFVRLGAAGTHHSLTHLSGSFVAQLYNRLATLGITLPRMSPRQFRAAGEHWWIKTYGLEAAATHAGNTPATLIRHYANGTAVDQRAEWTHVFQQMESQAKALAKQAVLGANDSLPNGVPNAIGLCAEQESPRPIMAAPPITPNCKSSQGCLFCERYKVHANEIDMRKLMSARYCITETSKNTLSTELAEKVFGAVVLRIDSLLEETKALEESLFLRVKSDVEVNQNLDPFWADKLLQLYELGLI